MAATSGVKVLVLAFCIDVCALFLKADSNRTCGQGPDTRFSARMLFEQTQWCNSSAGMVGAGTNNARLAGLLRSLGSYYYKEPTMLFLVRIAQGLVHMGKGLLTLNPYHTDNQLASGHPSQLPSPPYLPPTTFSADTNCWFLRSLRICCK